MLVSFALGNANFFRVLPDAKPKSKPVEYRLCWAPNAKLLHWPCTFHVYCVDFICVWCPTRTLFPVEYGLYVSYRKVIIYVSEFWLRIGISNACMTPFAILLT